MAVYTKVSIQKIEQLLIKYNVGKLVSIKEIDNGVENSNYFLTTNKNKFIFTIYEKRVNPADLPFYLNLMQHLSKKNIPTPLPISNNEGQILSTIADKPCAIISFLEGRSIKKITNDHLKELGENLAKLHTASNDFKLTKTNDMSKEQWANLFSQIKENCNKIKPGIKDEITTSLKYINNNWPKSLPKGIIHADLFPDNVFFEQDKLVGIIDFYFACNDFYMYDLAICLNAWCFEHNKDFNLTKAKILLSSYNKIRKISIDELNYLPVLAQGAALRFLLTRSYDLLNHDKSANVTPHNPLEYLHKLRFHQNINSHLEYGL